MNISRMISIGKILAISILVLGVIHDVASFTPLIRGGLSCLNPADLNAMVYMSLICGTSFILSGIVLVQLLRKLDQYGFLSSSILVIGIFLAISGVLSVIYMFDNPFAWLALVLNLSLFSIALGLRIKLGKGH